MTRSDPRYGTARWRKTSLIVRQRAAHQCWVPGCGRPATVADHITPVSATMPDHEFYAASNLRASCAPHNLRRGHVGRYLAEVRGVEVVESLGRPVRRYGRPQVW